MLKKKQERWGLLFVLGLILFSAGRYWYRESTKKALLDAALKGDVATVKTLLDRHIDAETLDWSLGRTQLGETFDAAHSETAHLLLAAGASPNARHYQYSVLQMACRKNDFALVETLLNRGAKIQGTGSEDYPLLVAAGNGNEALVKLFLTHGAEPNHRSEHRGYPLEAACAAGHVAIARMLVAAGADINRSSLHGATPLITAVCNNKAPVVEYLLSQHARTEITDRSGLTAYQQAERHKFPEVLAALKK